MPLPQSMKTVRLALALLLCAPAAASAPHALAQQQPVPDDPASAEARRGAHLYVSGDTKGAAKAFRAALKRRKDDPVLWLNLAQALLHRGEVDEARKALAIDARSIDAHYVIGMIRLREGAWLKAVEAADAIIKLDGRAAVAHSLKGEALLGLYERAEGVLGDERRGAYDFDERTVAEARAAQPRRLKDAADSFEKYLQLRPDAPDAPELRDQIESLRLYARRGPSDDAARIYTPGELTAKAVIVEKPAPGYTEEARRARVSGLVRLRAVLAFDGRVRNIHIRRLEFGLTEKAVAAARKIRFKPAQVNNLPVSQWVTLEYNFNVF